MKYILIVFALVIAFVGCSDQLDQLPSDSLPGEEAITNVDDLEKAVSGAYQALVHRYGYSGDYFLYADGKGGDVQMRDLSANHFQPIVIFQLHRNSGASSGIYQRFYYTTARINNILLFTEQITDKVERKDDYDDLIGQLYALRGLCHFELARTYAKLPAAAADLNAANSGIPLNDQYYDVKAKFKRSTLKETYDFIVSDLNKSLSLLKDEKVEASGFINHWAAKAILSRVYLYLGDNSNALDLANDVIDNGGYKLFTRENYLESWSKTGADESLFELQNTDISNAQRNSLGYYTDPEGYAECSASDEFKDWLLAQPKDIRSISIREKELVDKDGNSKYKAYYTVKYEGQSGSGVPLYANNPKVIRLSEVYLIAAEARLNGGTANGSKEAEWYYNELRANRIEDYTEVASVSIDDILDERRRELFCENHRMFDLVRYQRDIESPHVGTVTHDDYRILVAIPQRELDISPELEQNPGY